ncbi:MAG: hypothetical protein KC656_20685 [Myxococcales bacterium]|nr:hypothetical protein [Myxococcales bacterium]
MRIAYLVSRDTLPDAPSQRDDADALVRMLDALVPGFARRGLELVPVAWDAPDPGAGCDAALIGTTWDYWERADAFLTALGSLRIPLFNDLATVRWNADKRYLRALADAGVPTIPTAWLEPGERLGGALEALGAHEVVCKRVVGAGAYQQHRLTPADVGRAWDVPMMVQPFLPTIVSHGEISVVFVGGEPSHAVLKRAAAGDYRIQPLYGGTDAPLDLDGPLLDACRTALAAVPGAPLYARVDLLPDAAGRLLVMEVELIEPYLYPAAAPHLGDRLAAALQGAL